LIDPKIDNTKAQIINQIAYLYDMIIFNKNQFKTNISEIDSKTENLKSKNIQFIKLYNNFSNNRIEYGHTDKSFEKKKMLMYNPPKPLANSELLRMQSLRFEGLELPMTIDKVLFLKIKTWEQKDINVNQLNERLR
jgi:hypothetical protein